MNIILEIISILLMTFIIVAQEPTLKINLKWNKKLTTCAIALIVVNIINHFNFNIVSNFEVIGL